jgi:cytochrome c553
VQPADAGPAAAVAAGTGQAHPGGQGRAQQGIEGCIPCHGADGIARDAEVPNLAAQNAPYLYNQLKAFKSGERKTPMAGVMKPNADKLSDQDMADLAAYLSTLK